MRMWKDKFQCPICHRLDENEEWFVVDHMAKEHSTKELAHELFDYMLDCHTLLKRPVDIVK